MKIEQGKVSALIDLFRNRYPSWKSFRDTEFEQDEVTYKHATSQKLRERLGQDTLEQLLENEQYDEIIERIDTLINDNNLLYVASYSGGDHNILFSENFDKAAFCHTFYDLLYGNGSIEERFARYIDFVDNYGLPSKWTFPTYFLFLRYPETEILIKPRLIKWFLKFVEADINLESTPKASVYTSIKELVHDLEEQLSAYDPRDIIDIQGFLWVAYNQQENLDKGDTSIYRRDEFRKHFEEFLQSPYLDSEEGQFHQKRYGEAREEAKANYQNLLELYNAGEDITELVPRKFFPHDQRFASQSGWVHVAPATGDPKALYYQHYSEDERPRAAAAILDFVKQCVEDPEGLADHCHTFAESPYSKGAQAAYLTPILNALSPEDFAIVNGKVKDVVNYFTNGNYNTSLVNYPKLNAAIQSFIEEIERLRQSVEAPDMLAIDLFDTFAHWLVAKKQFFNSQAFSKTESVSVASPLDSVFLNKAEAHQVFDLINHAANKLGIQSEDDPRFSISLTNVRGRPELHLNYGNWLIFGLRGPDNRRPRVRMTLLEDQLPDNQFSIDSRFSTKEDEPEVVICGMSIETVSRQDEDVRNAFDNTLDFVKQRLQHYSRTPYRGSNVPELAHVVFDKEAREQVFETGFDFSDSQDPDSAFSEDTFRLLTELHEYQSKEYYQNNKEAMQQHVEKPLQEVLNAVANRLPDEITQRMETQKGVFARIPKNDFGRGGAWDFYWGAFYPKGGKRIQDAQLFAWINRHRLECGFSIRHNRAKQEQFLRNITEHKALIHSLMIDICDETIRVYEELDDSVQNLNDVHQNSISVHEWLEQTGETMLTFARVLPKDEVLTYSAEELISYIQDTFTRLYPLVILADESEPRDAIAQYVGESDDQEIEVQPEYSLSACADATGFDREQIEQWVNGIHRKKQAVLYGPPGTGKTFIAQHLATHLIGGTDGFTEIVQFHPSYSYEDFIQGIRPTTTEDGQLRYPLKKGRFYEFCEAARKREGTCVLIIDEINRANLSRVFGELMFLLEYRDEEVPLAGGRSFSIPSNVRIVGTMNTADRSIALVDHALRRRFAFLQLYPNFEVLRAFHAESNFPVERLIQLIERINGEIGDRHYHLGITYFLTENLTEELPDIWRMEIEPYLEEYFFDQPEKVDSFSWENVHNEVFG